MVATASPPRRAAARGVPRPRRLLLNLLLGAGGRPLDVRQAIAACGLFGIAENTVRVTLVRLSAERLVAAPRRGVYALGPAARSLAADVAQWRRAEQRVRVWHGDWLAVHVGGLGRADRRGVRRRERALGLLGLAELERGLFLRPDNLAGGAGALRDRLERLGMGPGALVFAARDLDAARQRQARALWDGETLTRRYRETRRRLDAWLERSGRLALAGAARESFLLGHEAIHDIVFDPLLPAPLVDVTARRDLVDTARRFDRAGRSIWQRFLATVPSDPSVRSSP